MPSAAIATEPTERHKSEQYETVRDVSLRLKIPQSTIRDLARLEKMPCLRISPRLIRFRPAEVDAWLASRAVGGAK